MVDYSSLPKTNVQVEYSSRVVHSSWADTAARRKPVENRMETEGVKKGVQPPPQRVVVQSTSSTCPPGFIKSPLQGVYPGAQAGLPGYNCYNPVVMTNKEEDGLLQELMGNIIPTSVMAPWEQPMSYEVDIHSNVHHDLKYSERGYVGVDKPEDFLQSRLVGTIEEQRVPPIGYVVKEERQLVKHEISFQDPRGVQISHQALNELNSLSWDIESLKHHVDGELQRRTVGEYQARERYLSLKLSATVAQVAQLKQDKENLGAELTKSQKDAEDLVDALEKEYARSKQVTHSGQPATAPQADIKSSLEYLSLQKEWEMLGKTLDLVTCSAGENKEELRELKNERKISREEVIRDKEAWIERERDWRSREVQLKAEASTHSAERATWGPCSSCGMVCAPSWKCGECPP